MSDPSRRITRYITRRTLPNWLAHQVDSPASYTRSSWHFDFNGLTCLPWITGSLDSILPTFFIRKEGKKRGKKRKKFGRVTDVSITLAKADISLCIYIHSQRSTNGIKTLYQCNSSIANSRECQHCFRKRNWKAQINW